jgi:hypothetical protein
MRTLTSPIIPMRTKSILKAMKTVGIPHYDHSCVAVAAGMEILENVKWTTRRCAFEPKCNSQLFIVMPQMKRLLSFLHSVSQNLVHCSSCKIVSLVLHGFHLFEDGAGHQQEMCCTSFFTSIQVDPTCFSTPLSSLSCCTFALRSHLPAAA